jgi:nitrite reductase/ring-hydroxylating ferredoxin subunit
VTSASGRPPLAEVDPTAPVGTILAAELDGTEIVVIRHAQGWVAVPDACPHADCAFSQDGELFDRTVLACNCHGSEFDLGSGTVLLGPAERPLVVVPLEERDGRLGAPEGGLNLG